jgi:hypothetical protein
MVHSTSNTHLYFLLFVVLICGTSPHTRLINIKIAKAYRTVSFEASCVLAGVPPIGIVIEEWARLYKIRHNFELGEHECEEPQPVKVWPHPALRPDYMEPRESTQYS